MKKEFYLSWLVLGLLQMLAFTACGSPTNADSLLANPPSESASSGSLQNRGGNGSSSPSSLPYSRLSLGFFDSKTQATLRIGTASSTQIQSDAAWAVGGAQGNAPAAGAISDNRAHEGCLSFADYSGVQLCFQVQGDVSNVGLNPTEMQISGLSDFISKSAGAADCTGTPTFQGAGSNGDFFEVEYQVNCSGGPIAVTLAVSKTQ